MPAQEQTDPIGQETFHRESGFLKPHIEKGISRDKLIERGLQPFSEISSSAYLLEEIAREMDIPYEYFNQIRERVFFNPLTPIFRPKVMGGFNTEEIYIELNPAILEMPNAKLMIAHVFFHEYNHMIGIYDEAITELMTVRKMKEVYKQVGFESGYSKIVNDLELLLGNRTYEELKAMMDMNQSDALNNMVAEIVVKDIFENSDSEQQLFENLRIGNLMYSAKYKWNKILELFPRLINSLDNKGKNLFEDAAMDWYQLNKRSIANMVIERIFTNSERAFRTLDALFKKQGKDGTGFYGVEGYDYLYEFALEKGMNLYQIYSGIKAQYEGQES